MPSSGFELPPNRPPSIGDGRRYHKVYDGSAWQASSPSSSASAGTGVVLQNAQAIAADLTLTTSYNGLSVGPVTVNAGTTVTVPANATWLVL